MSFFGYPVTRPIRLGGRWCLVLFWLIVTFYVVFITLLNVISVGYEPILVTLPTGSTSAGSLWYENLAFSSWLPPAISCNPTQLSLYQGKLMSQNSLTSLPAVRTQIGMFNYLIAWDAATTVDIEPLYYWGDPLSCTVTQVAFGLVNLTMQVRQLA
jgi:hypothetical protein